MIKITDTIAIAESELEYHFIRASGPGGQNVNKVAAAVQLRFNVHGSPSLPGDVRQRLARLAGKRVNDEGVLVIRAERFRSQERNRQDATERLGKMVRRASVPPRPRKPSAPSRASVERRLEAKRRRGQNKELRGPVTESEG